MEPIQNVHTLWWSLTLLGVHNDGIGQIRIQHSSEVEEGILKSDERFKVIEVYCMKQGCRT
jgi:hypothetical protein